MAGGRAAGIALKAALFLSALVGVVPAALPAPAASVAIIVHPANAMADPTLQQLRGLLSLDRQFWPDGHRVVLFLPPSNSTEKLVLLDRVYEMSDADLRKYWVAQLFRGSIPAIPASLRTSEAIGLAVQQSQGAISAVIAGAVPPGVRVLKIDGKSPGEPGYPLSSPGIR
jgi:hypothetical protein